MAKKMKMRPTIDVSGYFTANAPAGTLDADVGKGFVIDPTNSDVYTLAANGKAVDAWLVSVETATAGGYKVVTLDSLNMQYAEASGAMNVGDIVCAAAQAAIGVAETNGIPKVKKLTTPVVGQTLWKVVGGTTSDGAIASGDTDVVIKKV